MSKNNSFPNRKNGPVKKQVYRLNNEKRVSRNISLPKQKKSSMLKETQPVKNSFSTIERSKTYIPHKLTFAIISALTIGLISGFTMLHLLTDQEERSIEDTEQTIAPRQKSDESANNELDQLIDFEMPNLQAYTLQLGMFSDRDNAEQFAELIDDQQLYPMVWSKDDQHFVFVGLASTKQEAETLKETLIDDETEAFVKEWQTEAFTVRVSEREEQWLTDFVQAWGNLLNDQENIEEKTWQQLLKDVPKQSELLKPVVDELETMINNPLDDPLQTAQFLHLTWLTLSKFPKES